MADLFGEKVDAQDSGADPAAEFLAQQQDEIAGLENDIMGVNLSDDPQLNGFEENGLVDDDEINRLQDPSTNVDDSEVIDPSQVYAAIATADARLNELRSESEKIRIWREANEKLIAEKDRESEEKQKEWLTIARKELEDYDKNRNEQLEKTKKSNRNAEAQFVKERDFETPGSEWERVSKLCDFNPKSAKGNKDLTRMRSTLLQLKQHPRPVSVATVNGD